MYRKSTKQKDEVWKTFGKETERKDTVGDRKKKSLMLTKLSNYLRYGCENTHISAVSLSHRAAVYESIPACSMNV